MGRYPLVLTETRLRWGLAAIFLALALPTALLVYRAYGEAQWEIFHQVRGQAEALSAAIDSDLGRRVATEEARSYADYGFLLLADPTEPVFAQRSPLSEYPPPRSLPGLLGHFQVDSEGGFSSPLLPAAGLDPAAYGIAPAELAMRRTRCAALEAILTQRAAPLPEARAKLDSPGPEQALAAATRASPAERPGGAPAAIAQNAFERLTSAAPQGLQKPAANGYGSVADLELDSRLARKSERDFGDALMRKESARAETPPAPRASRKDQVTLYAPAGPTAAPSSADEPAADAYSLADETGVGADLELSGAKTGLPAAPLSPRMRLFESELGPMNFEAIDAAHFVLFRNVWHDGQRAIQGAVLDARTLRDEFIAPAFEETPLATMSRLTVAWQGEVQEVLGPRQTDASVHGGELLYRARLSAPLDGFELIYSVTALPLGASAHYLGWVTLVLMLVLAGGWYTIHRFGLGQLRLYRQQQEFVSAVSHELKTPLTSIRMYSEMLRAGWAEESKKAGYYAFIHDESERLSRLIGNVLELARVTRGQYRPVLKEVALGELIERVVARLATQLDRSGFVLDRELEAGASGARIAVDEDAFTQILINLVDNAIKFAPASAAKRIDLVCETPAEGRVRIRLRDYGAGIAREHLRRIFELFYRAESEMTRVTVGTGIGLALVRQLAAAMHGSVDVRNREPGAEFTLTLPLAAPSRS